MSKKNYKPGNKDKINRRNFIKKSVLGASALGMGANLSLSKKSNAEVSQLNFNTRSIKLKGGDVPNILMVMADQWRWDYIGCAGAGFLNTPNIDKLANEGVRFNQCTCNSPQCAPSRSSLASGMRSRRTGVLHNGFVYPINQIPTYYQALRNFGYRVGCVGKIDLHKAVSRFGKNGNTPFMYQLGFTDPFELEGKQTVRAIIGPYTNYLEEKGLFEKLYHDYFETRTGGDWSHYYSEDSVLKEEDFEDAWIGKLSCEWLDNVSEEFPWHYFVSFVGPHNPWDPPTNYADKYRSADVPEPIADTLEGKPAYQKNRQHTKGASMNELLNVRRKYCAMVDLIDTYIGRMVEILKKRNMYDNTLIILCADHGEMLGDHGMYYKNVPYDPSIRIPLILRGPGVKIKGVSNALVQLFDMYPTILETAGISVPNNIDAKSLMSILSGKKEKVRDYQFSEIYTGSINYQMVCDGRYKLVSNTFDIDEMYDRENDPGELNNIIDKYPDIQRKLQNALREMAF